MPTDAEIEERAKRIVRGRGGLPSNPPDRLSAGHGWDRRTHEEHEHYMALARAELDAEGAPREPMLEDAVEREN